MLKGISKNSPHGEMLNKLSRRNLFRPRFARVFVLGSSFLPF
jgi:hypothetical protein